LSSAEEPGWESPWGRGRPGWHIECSAMSKKYLGEVFDIHGGGLDLIFPHHENEIAQSRCAHNTSVMANVWMHNGFLQVEGKKMSKSDGNFLTIKDVLMDEPGEVHRLTMLRAHYRQPIDWTKQATVENFNVLHGWERQLRAKGVFPTKEELAPPVLEALLDDLNTPKAIAALHEVANASEYQMLANSLTAMGFSLEIDKDLGGRFRTLTNADIEKLKSQRLEYLRVRDFSAADQIRNSLEQVHRIQLTDSKDPVTGERVTTWDFKR
jgi:cysteinyl-tRNA synthetase